MPESAAVINLMLRVGQALASQISLAIEGFYLEWGPVPLATLANAKTVENMRALATLYDWVPELLANSSPLLLDVMVKAGALDPERAPYCLGAADHLIVPLTHTGAADDSGVVGLDRDQDAGELPPNQAA